jgi:threonine dehydrogenase-like Zn-dependent dehydrogenase
MKLRFLISALLLANVGAFAPSAHQARLSTTLSMTAETNEGKEIRVGVIGCGRIGIVHLGAITKAPNVTPVIVSNPTISKAEQGKLVHLVT